MSPVDQTHHVSEHESWCETCGRLMRVVMPEGTCVECGASIIAEPVSDADTLKELIDVGHQIAALGAEIATDEFTPLAEDADVADASKASST